LKQGQIGGRACHRIRTLPRPLVFSVSPQRRDEGELCDGGARAELGSAFLCADLDLTPEIREDHTAYIASWLEVLKNDKRAILSAAAHAQKAADYLAGLQAIAQREDAARSEHRRRGLLSAPPVPIDYGLSKHDRDQQAEGTAKISIAC